MSVIKMLPKDISELIAAGEVIERPCSIVKELIENAVDSGADSIAIEIKNGGVTYIRITDNGVGMSGNDISTAFLRHATSKISCKDDLERIMTLGFRGEALPSIAAISKVEVLTKQNGEQYGTRYVIEGSEEKLNEKSGCPVGTTFIVRDIFFNVPARLKFLKRDVTEGNAISAIVHKIALSNPNISFNFIRDNKQELFTPRGGDLFSTIRACYGKSYVNTLIPVDYTYNNIRVSGYTVKPIYARANRSFQCYFVNERYIKSMTCTVALEEAYKNSIMTGKFPACVLNLTVPPNVVDVNVHPAKIEVRFSNEKQIFDSVYFAVKNALLVSDSPMELQVKPIVKSNVNYANNNTEVQDYKQEEIAISPENNQKVIIKNLNIATDASSIENKINENVVNFEKPLSEFEEMAVNEFKYINSDSLLKKNEMSVATQKKEINIKIIGEAFANYIIAEIEDSIFIIDKHAAHERYIFEDIKSKIDKNGLDSQLLLEPTEILLSLEEFDAIISNMGILSRLGFTIESKKATSIMVLGIPVYLERNEPSDIIPEIADNLLKNKHNPEPEFLDNLFHSISCKAAIKANDKTNLLELKALVLRIYGNENIKYCPHGRPVMFQLTKAQLEKQFKRIV